MDIRDENGRINIAAVPVLADEDIVFVGELGWDVVEELDESYESYWHVLDGWAREHENRVVRLWALKGCARVRPNMPELRRLAADLINDVDRYLRVYSLSILRDHGWTKNACVFRYISLFFGRPRP
jgi:hypothetical protein